MLRVTARAAALLSVAAAASAATLAAAQPLAPTPSGSGPATLRLAPVKIIDQGRFGVRLTAATSMLPMGWRASGGLLVERGGACQRHIDWRAADPSGQLTLERLPTISWVYDQSRYPTRPTYRLPSSGCLNRRFDSADAFFADYQRALGSWRVLAKRKSPAIARAFAAFQINRPGQRAWVDHLIIDGAFQKNGVEMRQQLFITTFHVHFSGGYNAYIRNAGRGGATIAAVTAPAHRFREAALASHIFNTNYRANPEYQQLQRRKLMMQMRANAYAVAQMQKRSRIIADANAAVSRLIMDRWRDRNRVLDRTNRQVIARIREETAFSPPSGNGPPVYCPPGYVKAYAGPGGAVVCAQAGARPGPGHTPLTPL